MIKVFLNKLDLLISSAENIYELPKINTFKPRKVTISSYNNIEGHLK